MYDYSSADLYFPLCMCIWTETKYFEKKHNDFRFYKVSLFKVNYIKIIKIILLEHPVTTEKFCFLLSVTFIKFPKLL